jgi:hypothetical protein
MATTKAYSVKSCPSVSNHRRFKSFFTFSPFFLLESWIQRREHARHLTLPASTKACEAPMSNPIRRPNDRVEHTRFVGEWLRAGCRSLRFGKLKCHF